MHSLRSISKLAVQTMVLAGLILLGFVDGGAQPAQNLFASDPFASINHSLNRAADQALAAPLPQSTVAVRSESLSSPVTTEATTSKVSSPARAIDRVQQLRPILEPILREERVPTDLAAMVLVESGGQPNALSSKGARGVWQFMPDTARRYGLIVSPERDERLDVQRSTRAAARYLRDLYRQFGDWQLAFAAYNAGGELVQHAIERNQTSDFMRLSRGQSLPSETRKYVPAVINAMHRLENVGSFVAPPRGAKVAWILYAETQMATQENQAEFLKQTKGELR